MIMSFVPLVAFILYFPSSSLFIVNVKLADLVIVLTAVVVPSLKSSILSAITALPLSLIMVPDKVVNVSFESTGVSEITIVFLMKSFSVADSATSSRVIWVTFDLNLSVVVVVVMAYSPGVNLPSAGLLVIPSVSLFIDSPVSAFL